MKEITWSNYKFQPEARISVKRHNTTDGKYILSVFVNNIYVWQLRSDEFEPEAFKKNREEANSIATLTMHILSAAGIGIVEFRTI